jgi:guanylate kinase
MSAYPVPAAAGRFIVLIGPSGAGKSTLQTRYLESDPTARRCISCTTRAPRPGERDGVDYHFLAEAEFIRRRESGDFLEWAQVFGKHAYGTLRAPVEAAIAAGGVLLKDVDVQGGRQIRQSMPSAIQVFVAPSSHAELERRLRGRGTESEDAVRRRLAEVDRELPYWTSCDYLLINDDLDTAVRDLGAIVRAARLRVQPA